MENEKVSSFHSPRHPSSLPTTHYQAVLTWGTFPVIRISRGQEGGEWWNGANSLKENLECHIWKSAFFTVYTAWVVRGSLSTRAHIPMQIQFFLQILPWGPTQLPTCILQWDPSSSEPVFYDEFHLSTSFFPPSAKTAEEMAYCARYLQPSLRTALFLNVTGLRQRASRYCLAMHKLALSEVALAIEWWWEF